MLACEHRWRRHRRILATRRPGWWSPRPNRRRALGPLALTAASVGSFLLARTPVTRRGQVDSPPEHRGTCSPRRPASKTGRLFRLARRAGPPPNRSYPIGSVWPGCAGAAWLWGLAAGHARGLRQPEPTDACRDPPLAAGNTRR